MVRVFWPRVEDLFENSISRNDAIVLQSLSTHAEGVASQCEQTARLVSDVHGKLVLYQRARDAQVAARVYRHAAIRRVLMPSPWHLRVII